MIIEGHVVDTPNGDTNKGNKIEQINVSENDIMLDLSKLDKGTGIRLVFEQGEISLRI